MNVFFMEEWGIRKTIPMKFVLTLLFLTAFSSTAFSQEPWKFIVTCDSRGNDNGINQVVLSELVTEIKSQGVDFVIFSGDLVSGYRAIDTDEFEAQLRAWVEEIMKPLYDAGITVYVCRGNPVSLSMSAVAIMSLVMYGVLILIPAPAQTRMIITCCAGLTYSAATLTPNRSCPTTALQTRNL